MSKADQIICEHCKHIRFFDSLKNQFICKNPTCSEYNIDVVLNTSIYNLDNVLTERAKQHGDFSDHARVTQNIKRAMKDSPNWTKLSDTQLEGLEMVAHKIGRILSGDKDFEDHYLDSEGYFRITRERLPKDKSDIVFQTSVKR